MGASWPKHAPSFQSSSRLAQPQPPPRSRASRRAMLRRGYGRVDNASPRRKRPPKQRTLKRPSRYHLALPPVQLPAPFQQLRQLSRAPTASKPPRSRSVKRSPFRRSNQRLRAQKCPRPRRPNPNQSVRRRSRASDSPPGDHPAAEIGSNGQRAAPPPVGDAKMASNVAPEPALTKSSLPKGSPQGTKSDPRAPTGSSTADRPQPLPTAEPGSSSEHAALQPIGDAKPTSPPTNAGEVAGVGERASGVAPAKGGGQEALPVVKASASGCRPKSEARPGIRSRSCRRDKDRIKRSRRVPFGGGSCSHPRRAAADPSKDHQRAGTKRVP